MENRDLYDGERHLLRQTIERGASHPAGTYHLAVNIWVVNSNAQLLLTLRAPEKEQYPNLWENQSGSVQAGEKSLPAAQRELTEETGGWSKLILPFWGRLGKRSLWYCFTLRRDITAQEIHLQAEETVAAQWVTSKELETTVDAGQISDAPMRRKSCPSRMERFPDE
ncbi:MAG: NUDIX domain-containing protein [Faecousia sp.]